MRERTYIYFLYTEVIYTNHNILPPFCFIYSTLIQMKKMGGQGSIEHSWLYFLSPSDYPRHKILGLECVCGFCRLSAPQEAECKDSFMPLFISPVLGLPAAHSPVVWKVRIFAPLHAFPWPCPPAPGVRGVAYITSSTPPEVSFVVRESSTGPLSCLKSAVCHSRTLTLYLD